MILKVSEDGSLKNMHVAYFPEMVLFWTSLDLADDDSMEDAKINIAYRPPHGEHKSLDVPLTPDTSDLAQIEVEMHKSPTQAYDMGSRYNVWFSSCFGYDVVLAYLGPHYRSVLMSTSDTKQSKGWLSSISSMVLGNSKNEITFADCAPYLVVSETSMEDVTRRLPVGEEMDIVKFRPNIIVSGAEKAWDEDYWGQIQLGDAVLNCEHNCVRCQSINIDYTTGKPGTGESGKVLKKLQSDRRVDPGGKYSPVFGRYSFLQPNCQGKRIAVGDEVAITKRNTEGTVFGTSWNVFGIGIEN